MKKKCMKMTALALAGVMAFGLAACGSKEAKSPLDAKNPTTITIWNYYNGDQQTAFENLVSDFNSTVGTEQGIAVETVSQGSIDNLADALIDAAEGKVGAQDVPTLASVYSETAYILEQKDLLVNLEDYFTEEELSAYFPQFIEEGRFVENGDLLLFPISKSTECFVVNKTDWAAFEEATGITIESIDSYESLVSAAQKYYEWTDSLTPDVADDGNALYGRDSISNYIFTGTTQLGHEMFKVTSDGVDIDLDRDTFKTLWDNYYIPFINGYFMEGSKYRSEDMKMGSILSMTGSTSGVSYLPTAVTDENDVSHDIELQVEMPLNFKNGEKVAVQQGAGFCVFKGTEQEQYAAVEFLKWFTDPAQNLDFSISSGYSAVTKEANDTDKIKEAIAASDNSSKEQNILDALLVSADVYANEDTYTVKPFDGSKEVRNVLGDALLNTAVTDRAAVVSAMEQGQTREEATAQYSTDEYFDQWFDALTTSVKGTVK